VVKLLERATAGIRDFWSDESLNETDDEKEMTLIQHLEELRSRFLKAGLALLGMTMLSLIFTPRFLEILKAPAPPGTNLVFIEVTEMFLTYFQVALMAGIGLASPVILYQLIAFISPGLTRREKRLLKVALPFVVIFFAFGVLFGYFITLRFALSYLLGLFPEFASPQIRIENFITFVSTVLLWMGIAFEMPVVVYVIAKLGIVTPDKLARYRKYAILLFFVIAAIITPTPDPLNQTLVAAPMIVLYEVGIFIARVF
jgi:sec-independent protein translocase protein TatC